MDLLNLAAFCTDCSTDSVSYANWPCKQSNFRPSWCA